MFADDGSYSPDHQGHTPDKRYNAAPYGSSTDLSFMPDLDDDRPPPPPVHRITPGGTPQNQTPPVMRKDVLRNEAHRQSVPSNANAYPGRPVYRGHDSAPASSPPNFDSYGSVGHQVSQPRHHSYDAPYDSHHRSLQPTVEDVPDSPGAGMVEEYRRSSPRAPLYEAGRHDPTPSPLNVGGRSSAPAGPYQASHRQSVSPDYARSDHLMEYGGPHASQSSYDLPSTYNPPRTGFEHELPGSQVNIPAALIPGVAMSSEDRRRHIQPPPSQPPVGSMRGRQMIDLPPSYSAPPEAQFNASPHNLDAYERNPVPYYAGAPPSQQGTIRDASPGYSPGRMLRDVSPGGQSPVRNTIRRKSVSPAPPIEQRRLSAIPFGPDDYDALNPTVAAPKRRTEGRMEDAPVGALVAADYDEIDGKIITYDGREVDPSDHLPMDTWAPEPEPKKPSASTSSRATPSGPQPPPPSGRKALRIRERPASAIFPSTYIPPESSLPPPLSGRNRLQKKANHRTSAMPLMSGANGLGPQQLQQDNFAPRALARASTMDYENYAPVGMGMRDHSASAPPIPAKVPMAGPGAMVSYGGGGDSLMEEMSRIDIGTGRARRHAQNRPAIGGY